MRKNLIHKIFVFRNVFLLVILCNTNLFSQKDSTKFIDKFYLELSAGPGFYHNNDYFDYNQPHIINRLSINLISKFYYKNKRLKSGITYGCLFTSGYINQVYSFEAGLNLFSKNAYPQHLGPSLAYGLFYNKIGMTLGQRFIKFGFDYFYNKFHVAANYQWIAFENAPFRKGNFKTTNIYLEFGYAFNLESFRKKK